MKNILIAVLVTLLVVTGIMSWMAFKKEPTTVGSVSVGGEYFATTTEDITNTLYKAADTTQLIKTYWDESASTTLSSVTLGDVVVASSTNQTIRFYDATSTAAILKGGISADMEVFSLASNTPTGTYELDISMKYGLVIHMGINFGGNYIITYR